MEWIDPWCDLEPGHAGGCARLAGQTTARDLAGEPLRIAVVVEADLERVATRLAIRGRWATRARLDVDELDALIEALSEARHAAAMAPVGEAAR